MSGQIADGVYQFNGSDTVLADGMWKETRGTSLYLVESEAKLSSIPNAAPGDFAYTAGYEDVWQMDTDGQTWVDVSIDIQEGFGSILALRHMSVGG